MMTPFTLILLGIAGAAASGDFTGPFWDTSLPAFQLYPGTTSTTCSIADYSNDVQKAMDACCKKGGGRVAVPKGSYTVKPFEFSCDNLELSVDLGAKLYASKNRKDYKGQDKPHFIFASNKKNIAITGEGTIDGNGSEWWGDSSTNGHPYMVLFLDCNTVTVQDIKLQNSAKLTLVPKRSNNVKIYNITIHNPFGSGKNLDCIDPSGSNIHIKKANLICGDDNVAVKGGSKNILVEKVTCGTGHGLSVGSIEDDNVQNVTFRDCTMSGTTNGVRIKATSGFSGGKISSITFDSITMNKVHNPMVIDGAYGFQSGNFSSSDSAVIKDITFINIRAKNSDKGAQLLCTSKEPCTGIVLNNVDIEPVDKASCTHVSGKTKGTVKPSSLKNCV